MIKKVEVLANIAVIVTSLVVCSIVGKEYLLSTDKQPSAAATPSEAAKVIAEVQQ